LSAVCRANKRDGSPCTAPTTGADGYCWAHDPANAERRRRIASRGGRGRGGGELPDLKRQLKGLAADVLSGEVDRGAAAVVNQILNTVIRAIEQERKQRELEEMAGRLEALEEILKARRGA
jgi:hypothetical protein